MYEQAEKLKYCLMFEKAVLMDRLTWQQAAPEPVWCCGAPNDLAPSVVAR